MIALPNEKGELRTSRLNRFLHKALTRSLTLVSGVPGIGKTTSVYNFLETVKIPYVIYSLESNGNRIENFLNVLTLQFKAVLPELCYEGLERSSPEEFAQGLLERGKALHKAKDFFIVIDDYYAASRSNGFHDYLQLLISCSTPNLHYIIIAEEELSWDKLPNRISRNIFKVSEEQLLFTWEEAYELYQQIVNPALSEEQIKRIYALTDGWVIALEIIWEKIQMEPDLITALCVNPYNAINRLPELNDYVDRAVFRLLSDEEKYVLFATSLCQEFSEELAARIAGSNAPVLLQQLWGKNRLISCRTTTVKTYKYSRIWQCILLNKAYEVLGYEKIAELQQKVGLYYLEKRQQREAVYHFIEAKDLERIIEVIRQYGPEVLDNELSRKFYYLLTNQQNSKLLTNPWYQLSYACTLRFKDPELCYFYVNKALEAFQIIGDSPGMLSALFIKAETLMFYTGGLHKMADLINDPELNSMPERASELRIVAYKQIYAGWSHCYLTGNLPEAVRLGERSRRISILFNDNSLFAWSSWVLGIAHTYAGNFDLAKGYILEAIDKIATSKVDAPLTMMIPYIAGFNASYAGDFAAAKQHLENAAAKAKEHGFLAFNLYIMNYYAYALDYSGDVQAGEKFLNEMRESMMTYLKEDNYHARSFILAARAHHSYLMEKYFQALNYAQQSLELRQKASGEMFFVRTLLILGATERKLGKFTEAEAHLLDSLQRSAASSSEFFEASCYSQLALLFADIGDIERSRQYLEKFLTIPISKTFKPILNWTD